MRPVVLDFAPFDSPNFSEGGRASVERWMDHDIMFGSGYLCYGRFDERWHISEGQYTRFFRYCVTSTSLEAMIYGSHSIHGTKVAQIYKKTDNLRATQFFLGQHGQVKRKIRLSVRLAIQLLLSWQWWKVQINSYVISFGRRIDEFCN